MTYNEFHSSRDIPKSLIIFLIIPTTMSLLPCMGNGIR